MLISNEVIHYIEQQIPNRDPLIKEMEHFAKEHNVPIMELVGIEIMLQILKFIKPPSILEIGTAIGYSAIRMAKALPKTKIVTIERDEKRYKQALDFIKQAGLQNQIDVHFGDALHVDLEIKSKGPFGCLFIDAAKGQYKRFFEIYSQHLLNEGVVISDNVLFKGMVAEGHIENKRLRGMVRKLKDYNEWLMNHEEFETTLYPVGDGIAISRKR